MDNTLFGIANLDVYVVLGIIIFFVLVETLAGYWVNTKRNFGDWIQEAGGFFVLSLLIKPTIVASVFYLGRFLLPEYQNIIGDWSLWLMLPFYLFIDDVMQY